MLALSVCKPGRKVTIVARGSDRGTSRRGSRHQEERHNDVCQSNGGLRQPKPPTPSVVVTRPRNTFLPVKTGLGIEAQRLALDAFAKANGFEIVAEFVEVHRRGLVLRSRPVDGGERGLVAETLLDNLWQKP